MNIKQLPFSQMPLARSGHLRKSEAWYQQTLADEQTEFVFIFRGQCLFINQEILQIRLSSEQKSRLQQYHCESYLLGLNDQEVAVFIVDISTLNDEQINQLALTKTHIEFIEFRAALALLTFQQVATIGYGKALCQWHKAYQYCGYCGAKALSIESGHARKCSSEHCGKLHFPRTDPVVIMLVEYTNEQGEQFCLLANHTKSPELLYSTLAGFVDPGESLEEAVIREVHEEAGIDVKQVDYIASQPWPFPNSLMIGFYAKALNNQFTIDEEELRQAGWFSKSQVRDFSDWGTNDNNIQIPRKESISRYLIEHWLAS